MAFDKVEQAIPLRKRKIMYKNSKVSLVIPAYNEEKGIEAVIREVPAIIDETIVIDNASTDRTAEIASRLRTKVVLERRRGYGAAYKKGFQEASGDIIVTLDADGMYPVKAIPYLVEVLVKESLSFITVQRRNDWIRRISDWTLENWFRYFGNIILGLFIYAVFGIKLRDSQSGMWVFRKGILNDLHLTSDSWSFSEELKIEVFLNKKLRAKEIAQPYSNKRIGTSKLDLFPDGFANLAFLFKKRFGAK
jgi:hypothetical protein